VDLLEQVLLARSRPVATTLVARPPTVFDVRVSNASWLWARSQWRRSRAQLVLCAAVLAITGSLSLGAATAAGRAASAMDRLREQTGAADVELHAESADSVDAVAAVASNLYFVQPTGVDEAIGSGFTAATQRQLLDRPANVPILLEGRRSDPNNSNEIEVSERFATRHGLAPGDVVPFESMTVEDVDAWFAGTNVGRPEGPQLELQVTGVVVAPVDFSNPAGTIYLTEAFGAEYADVIAHFDFLYVRLRDQATAQALLAAGAVGGIGVSATEWSAVTEVDDGLRIVALGLWVFAGTVALSGLAVFWLLTRRLGRSFRSETWAMSTMGLDRRGVVWGGILLFLPAAAAGIGIALITAPFVATHLRLGLAGDVEPNRGVHVDVGAMLLFGLGLTLLAAATAAASLNIRRTSTGSADTRRSSLVRVRKPVSLVVAVRDAVRRGDRTSPGQVTLLLSATVTAAAVASLAFGFSLDALANSPQAWGDGADVNIGFGDSTTDASSRYDENLSDLTGDQRVRDLNGWLLFDADVGGPAVKGVAIDTRQGSPIITVLSGRAPSTADEVALGLATMERFGHRLGDQIAITVGRSTQMFEAVGTVAFPDGDMTFDDGVAITEAGSRRFQGFNDNWLLYYTRLTWVDGVDHARAATDLSEAGFELVQASLPPAVDNLGQLGGLPSVLAGFFVLLAMSALAYSLSLSSRTGRPRAAVLVALGLDPRSVRSVIGYQAIAVGLLTMAIGVPVGLVAGRLLWTTVTDRAGIVALHTDPVVLTTNAVGIGVAGSIVIGAGFVIGMRRGRLLDAIRAD
jgi:putative ABC transport system permease protein